MVARTVDTGDTSHDAAAATCHLPFAQETLVVTARSSRQRRLAHFAAEAEGLLHRTENKRSVVVRRPKA